MFSVPQVCRQDCLTVTVTQTATSFQRAKENKLRFVPLFCECAYLIKNIALYQLLYMFSCKSSIEIHVGLGWSLEKVFIGLPKPSA